MPPRAEHEHTLNVVLASLLARQGLAAKPEVSRTASTGEKRRLDVEVKLKPATLAIEAKQGQTPRARREACEDADERLKLRLGDGAIALCYPDDCDEHSLPTAELAWSVRTDPGTQPTWQSGGLLQFASVVRLTPAQLGNPDFAAATLSASLDAAVEGMSESVKRNLAAAMDLPKAKSSGKSNLSPWDRPAKRALLVVATAVMFHARLDPYMRDDRPETDARKGADAKFVGTWPPARAPQCAESENPIGSFLEAWDLILARDYKPIFSTARYALLEGRADPTFARALDITAQAALAVVDNIASLHHDLLGRIFHTVLDSAKYDGSFYTTTAAATMLATLAIDSRDCDWDSVDAIAQFRVTDPSCGTGTLLMAAAERIRMLAPDQPAPNGEANKLDKALIERVLTGFDVNLTATHLAATTLGLLSPTTHFTDMKIGMTYLGVDEANSAHLGSLEFLDRQPKLVPWPSNEPSTKQAIDGTDMAWNEPSDLVIMNPPFTRNSLRHDQFSKSDEKLMKAREANILAGGPVHLSSNGNAFVVLADHLIKRDRGTIAAILPLVTATNQSSQDIREFLAREFHVETIVTSHDPKRIYFSENTSIGEILLIGKRRASGDAADKPTKVVKLTRNPSTTTEAFSTAIAIHGDDIERSGLGTVFHWPSDLIQEGDWGAVQFLSPELCGIFQQLKRGGLFAVAPVSENAMLSPGGRAIRDAFERATVPSPGGMRALWDHDTDAIQSMHAATDTDIRAKATKGTQAKRYWSERGCTMLPTRLFLPRTRATAVRLEEPTVGSAWVPCKYTGSDFPAEDWEQSAAVYFNSSMGILALLGDRSNRKPTYPNLSMSDLNRLPFPEWGVNDKDAVDLLAATFRRLSKQELKPLPGMIDCETRQALDESVGEALELDSRLIVDIRHALAREPSVTGRRYETSPRN